MPIVVEVISESSVPVSTVSFFIFSDSALYRRPPPMKRTRATARMMINFLYFMIISSVSD